MVKKMCCGLLAVDDYPQHLMLILKYWYLRIILLFVSVEIFVIGLVGS